MATNATVGSDDGECDADGDGDKDGAEDEAHEIRELRSEI